MAAILFGDGGDAGRRAGWFAKSVYFGGSIASLALVVAVGVWVHQMVVRDVSQVPIVRAIEGPMRIAPEHPGGIVASNQGLAVNHVVGSGKVAEPAGLVLLAPRKRTTGTPSLPSATVENARPVADDSRDQSTTGGATDLPTSASGEQGRVVMAQIGSLPSSSAAHSEWVRLASLNGDLFDGRSRVVDRVQVQDRDWWRLRAAGFNSVDEAHAFCTRLAQKRVECKVRVVMSDTP